MRIALLTEIPAPYRVPLFNALAEQPDVELRVFFLARTDPRRSYRVHDDEHRFEEETLGGLELRPGGRWLVLSPRVLRALQRFRPDAVIVGGWNQPAFLLALLWGRARRVPVASWVESTARDARSGAPPLELAKRALIRSFAGFVVPGRASADYLGAFGVPPERIAVAPNAVDPTIFLDRVDRIRDGRPANERCSFLYTGRLEPEKNVGALVEAVRDLDAELVVAGTGSEEAALRRLAPPNVRFTGNVDRDELPALYAAADAYVLPSVSEQWGMTLNEAALAGLPIVATDAAGAAYELVDDEVNGFRIPAHDPQALRRALERLASDPAFRARAGARSRELGLRLSPEAWAEAVANFVRTRLS